MHVHGGSAQHCTCTAMHLVLCSVEERLKSKGEVLITHDNAKVKVFDSLHQMLPLSEHKYRLDNSNTNANI